jgi:hypothetical protein
MAFSFQKDVALENKKAIPGDRANQQVVIYAPTNFTTKGTVKVGGFVWRDTTDTAKVVAAGTGAPLGFMERVQNFVNYDISVEGTLEVPENSEVNVAIQGDFYVVADATVAIGDTVYADTTTGAVTFTSGDDTVDSGFKAFTAGASGDVVIITKR